MSVRVKRFSAVGFGNPGFSSFQDDCTREQRETTVNGYTFHWATNEVRNFLDDGVGAAHAAFAPGANVIESTVDFSTSRS